MSIPNLSSMLSRTVLTALGLALCLAACAEDASPDAEQVGDASARVRRDVSSVDSSQGDSESDSGAFDDARTDVQQGSDQNAAGEDLNGGTSCQPGSFPSDCSAGQVCYEGSCEASCTAYPSGDFVDSSGDSNGRWESNGCPHTADTVYSCVAFNDDNSQILSGDPPAYCAERQRSRAVGELGDSCVDNPDCNPEYACVGETGESVCTKLCQPFSGSASADCPDEQYCQPITLSDGTSQAFGVCTSPDTQAIDGQSCTSSDLQCSDDDTICIPIVTSSTYRCRRLCQIGVASTCPTGTCSREGVSFSDAEPNWLGVCLTQ
ncbi:MAG: hypothetical protein KC561_01065 [Myxococcales bacterium]|nr:hypothetical protein [Myxococcales bacterium]